MNNSRIQRIIENMQAEGLSQILITAPASIFYLTDKWIAPGERMLALYLNENGETRLYANRLFCLKGNMDADVVEFDDIEDPIAMLSESVRPGRLGIDKFWPSQFTIRLMEARGDVRPVLGSAPVDAARMHKDEEELRRMYESSQLNVKACQKAIDSMYEGMTELELEAIYGKSALEVGGAANAFAPITCFGANCAEPHHDNDGTKLKKGDSVILDVGLMWKDYCSDMTRTAFFGEPSDEQKRVYDLVYAANRAGIAAAKPGVRMCDIDRAARKVIEDAGYGKYFTHRLGHGIGLEVHEFPDCSSTNEMLAEPGMVFSIEPGVYLPGRFGVRYEDLIAITEDGCKVLTE